MVPFAGGALRWENEFKTHSKQKYLSAKLPNVECAILRHIQRHPINRVWCTAGSPLLFRTESDSTWYSTDRTSRPMKTAAWYTERSSCWSTYRYNGSCISSYLAPTPDPGLDRTTCLGASIQRRRMVCWQLAKAAMPNDRAGDAIAVFSDI